MTDGKASIGLQDSFARVFKYLRLSITEVCNYRCTYCLPNGYQAPKIKPTFLSVPEIKNLAVAFAEMGVEKIRLTGGEPSLRQDLCEVISTIKEVKQVKTVALTTNAWSLKKNLVNLKQAGLDQLNISLDSLNPDTFYQITGKKDSLSIQKSIDEALSLGFSKVKINVVLLKTVNDHQVFDFIDWARSRPVDIRFIELMRTAKDTDFFSKYHISPEALIGQLKRLGWNYQNKTNLDGPAMVYNHSDYQGKVGFIAAYSSGFCDGCNRLRVSAVGALRLCLWGSGDHSLRDLLQYPEQKQELKTLVHHLLKVKPERHWLNNENSGDMNSLSTIGG